MPSISCASITRARSTLGRGPAGESIANRRDHRAEDVYRAQDDFDLGGSDRHPARSRAVEQRLDRVRRGLKAGEAERARVAFDRVERAEDSVEQVGVAGCRFETQNQRLDGAEVIQSLGDEHARQLGIAGEHREVVTGTIGFG